MSIKTLYKKILKEDITDKDIQDLIKKHGLEGDGDVTVASLKEVITAMIEAWRTHDIKGVIDLGMAAEEYATFIGPGEYNSDEEVQITSQQQKLVYDVTEILHDYQDDNFKPNEEAQGMFDNQELDNAIEKLGSSVRTFGVPGKTKKPMMNSITRNVPSLTEVFKRKVK